MFEVLTAHGDDATRWDQLVDYLPFDLRDVHVSSAWGRLNEKPGVTAHLAVLIDEEQGYLVCQPFLQRKINSTPLIDLTSAGYGGPMTSSVLPTKWESNNFQKGWIEWCDANRVVSEFYLANPVHAAHQSVLLAYDSGEIMERTVVLLHLGDDEELVRGMRPNRRQSLRKANSATIKPVDGTTMWAVYNQAMQRKAAAERWQLSPTYFNRLLDHGGTVLGAYDGHQLKAVAAFLLQGRATAYYHLAATTEPPASGFADQLIVAGAKLAKNAGFDWLHLGGGLSMAPDDSLLQYKASFGGIKRPVYSVRKVHNREAYDRLSGDRLTAFFPAYREGEAR